MNVVIAGGGTGGHVYPGLALADRLVGDHGATVSFIGSLTGPEAATIPAAGYRFDGIEAAQLRRELSWRAARAPFIAARSVRRCRPLLAGADVLVGVGGYASVAAGLAAGRVPLVLHEQNAVPGLANRLLSRRARAVASTFADARSRFHGRAAFSVTGNPLRRPIIEVPERRTRLVEEACRRFGLDPGRRTILVMGGSQGALALDRLAAALAPRMSDRADLQMLVLSGAAHGAVVASSDAATGLRVHVVPFLDRMELAYAMADLAVSRAGSGSICELAVCGIPMVLVPYPHATEHHQDANARELERAGAAVVATERGLSPEGLERIVEELLGDDERRRSMGTSAAAWSKPDADVRLARIVVGLVR